MAAIIFGSLLQTSAVLVLQICSLLSKKNQILSQERRKCEPFMLMEKRHRNCKIPWQNSFCIFRNNILKSLLMSAIFFLALVTLAEEFVSQARNVHIAICLCHQNITQRPQTHINFMEKLLQGYQQKIFLFDLMK